MYPKAVFSFGVLFVIVPLVVGNPWVQRSQRSPAIYTPPKSFILEEACVRQGGLCQPKNECGELAQSQVDLCPLQKHLGVECCYEYK
ncbi:uncharacterized protein LOC120636653 [Pararge aegeria]|nr:uncharacterized protein LOC120636653 [Pararge aegeria]